MKFLYPRIANTYELNFKFWEFIRDGMIFLLGD